MIQRIMKDLMGMKNVLVINDEAHHCYREKPKEADDEDLKGEDKKEAEKNNEAARLWISGLEAVNRKLGVSRVIDGLAGRRRVHGRPLRVLAPHRRAWWNDSGSALWCMLVKGTVGS